MKMKLKKCHKTGYLLTMTNPPDIDYTPPIVNSLKCPNQVREIYVSPTNVKSIKSNLQYYDFKK